MCKCATGIVLLKEGVGSESDACDAKILWVRDEPATVLQGSSRVEVHSFSPYLAPRQIKM